MLGPDELAAVERVFASGALTNGPETEAFEAEFAARHGCAHGVAFANGTVALAAIMLGLGLGPGDEVIVPSMTFISTATSVIHVGATPVFADIERHSWGLDPDDVEARVTTATKAIMAVHYGGQPCDMEGLRAVADRHGLALIEDAAEAHGASHEGRPVGGLGVAGMFSFTPTKNITTGEGGLVTTHDAALAERLRLLRNHGQTSQYEHTVLGFNWRLSEMQAAIGRVQLAKLDAVNARLASLAGTLADQLDDIAGIAPPRAVEGRTHVYMLFTTTVDEGRDRLLDALHAADIEARLYFPPAHRQPVLGHLGVDLPVTDWAAEHFCSLPLHGRLTGSDLDRMVDVVAGALSP